MYEYQAKVIKIQDGDSLIVLTDLGFRITQEMKLRLFGIDTPKIYGPTREAGLAAKAYVQGALTVGSTIRVRTYKDRTEKYGRYLAEIFYGNPDLPICLNQELIELGLAEVYED